MRYLIKNIVFVVLVFILHGSHAMGQGNEALIKNDYHEFGIRADGVFFEKKDSSPWFGINPSKHQMIDFSGMWVVAKRSDQQKVGFIAREKSKSELRSGPIDTLFNKAINNPTDWDHVWQINDEEIQDHKKNWDQGTYQAPWSISNWPARHNQNYVPSIMAPFVDWNQDRKYNPQDGDYPYFKGDRMMYFIANDEGSEHDISGSASMTIEVQGLVYQYDKPGMEDVIFASIYLINRSDEDYDSLFFGQYSHFALGKTDDNYLATNADQSAIYGYNGDSDDEGAFGTDLPYAACILLSPNATSSIGFNDADSVRKFPSNVTEIWNVVQGKWRNGAGINYGGNGHSTTDPVGRFIYAGPSDIENPFTNWTNGESSDGVGIRNGLITSGPYSLKNNQVMKFDLAFVSGLQKDKIDHSAIRNKIDEVRRFHAFNLNSPTVELSSNAKLFPNPCLAGQQPVFQCNERSVVRVVNAIGKEVFFGELESGTHHLEFERIPGIYLIEVSSQQNKSHFKLFLE